MIVAYMIVNFIYILLSNSCQGTIIRNGYGYPAIGSRRGIFTQIWVSIPRHTCPPYQNFHTLSQILHIPSMPL